jgi:hypothetical protein
MTLQTPVHAQTARTFDELRDLPRDRVEDVGKRDLAAILKSAEIEHKSFAGFSGIRLRTDSFATGYEGLCRVDVIVLRYMSDGTLREGRRQKKARRVDAEHWFHVIKLPPAGELMEYSPEALRQPGCDGLARDSLDGWFKANDEHQASTAITMLTWPPKPNAPQPAHDCGDCDGIQETADHRNLDEVRACPGEAGTLCYEMLFYYRRGIGHYVTTLTIKARVTPLEQVPTEILSRSYDTGMLTGIGAL